MNQKLLLDLARQSIQFGLKYRQQMTVNLDEFPRALQEIQACFVTLEIDQQLRGCVGSLEAWQPLVIDLSHNAYAAAFQDMRFAPLTSHEYPKLQLSLSILSTPEPMHYADEEDLISQLRPNIDGLILSDNTHKGTFLPSVWHSEPDPSLFFRRLKQKAGLASSYWSDSVRVARYTTEYIS